MPMKVVSRFIFIAVRVIWSANSGLTRINSDVIEAFSYNMSSRDRREIIKIVYEYFEFIEAEWERFQKEKN